jgi:subtilisin family serine protease
VFKNDNFLVLVAAGNDGTSSYEGTSLDPATAKNVIAVGATASSLSNAREYSFSAMGVGEEAAFNGLTPTTLSDSVLAPGNVHFQRAGYPANTYKVYNVSNFYSSDALASFSSRGPTTGMQMQRFLFTYSCSSLSLTIFLTRLLVFTDGRIKPDLVAPGQNILSPSSDSNQTSQNDDVTWMSGTSMVFSAHL